MVDVLSTFLLQVTTVHSIDHDGMVKTFKGIGSKIMAQRTFVNVQVTCTTHAKIMQCATVSNTRLNHSVIRFFGIKSRNKQVKVMNKKAF